MIAVGGIEQQTLSILAHHGLLPKGRMGSDLMECEAVKMNAGRASAE